MDMIGSLGTRHSGKPFCTPWKQSAPRSLRSGGSTGAAKQPPQQQQKQQPIEQQSNSRPPANEPPLNNANSEGLGKASPDVLRLFSETQRNLLELNRSRVSALDELRVARNKISDLESQLQERAESSCNKEEAASQQSDADNHEEPPSSHQAVGQNTITIAYQTGWARVMMHYSADNQTWTDLPGVEMQTGKGAFAASKVLQVRGTRLEFVLNDGAGQWDTPDPYGSSQSKNYIISTPGKYRLEAGEIRQVD